MFFRNIRPVTYYDLTNGDVLSCNESVTIRAILQVIARMHICPQDTELPSPIASIVDCKLCDFMSNCAWIDGWVGGWVGVWVGGWVGVWVALHAQLLKFYHMCWTAKELPQQFKDALIIAIYKKG